MEAQYAPENPTVLKTSGFWIDIFVGDNIPGSGQLVCFEPSSETKRYGVTYQNLGQRRVRVLVLSGRQHIQKGDNVSILPDKAFISGPPAPGEFIDLEEIEFLPKSTGGNLVPFELNSPNFETVRHQFRATELGYKYLDSLSPIAEGGMNLVLDNSNSFDIFERLTQKAADATCPTHKLWVGSPERLDMDATCKGLCDESDDGSKSSHLIALRVAASWIQYWRDQKHEESFIAAEFPALATDKTAETREPSKNRSVQQVINRLSSKFASTHSTTVTSLLRFPLKRSDEGVSTIAETLKLGSSETHIFVDDLGHYRPRRSASNVKIEESKTRETLRKTLSRAKHLEDKKQLLGKAGLSPDERQLLNREAQMYEKL